MSPVRDQGAPDSLERNAQNGMTPASLLFVPIHMLAFLAEHLSGSPQSRLEASRAASGYEIRAAFP